MNVLRKNLSIAVLLAIGMIGAAQAGPGRDQREGGGRPDRGERREFNFDRQTDRQQADSGDSGRKHGRLTPEERRNLRRQINEAGQDIYLPRR